MRDGALRLFTGGLAGKLLGVVREVLLAAAFGTSGEVAALRVAQTATLAPVNFFSADTLSAGFVPHHSRMVVSDTRAAAIFYGSVRNVLAVVAAGVTAILAVWPHEISRLIAPGFDSNTHSLTASMLVVMALGVPPYLYTALSSYLEMSHGLYVIASVRSSVQSIGLIAGVGAAVWAGSPVFLAWGFTAAYWCLAAWAGVRVTRHRLIERPADVTRDERLASYTLLWRTIRPLLALPILLQGAIVVERAVATLISTDAVAALDYARVFSDTAVLLIATPLGLASLSSLAGVSRAELVSKASRALALLVPVGLLASVILGFYGTTLISLIYGRGAFGDASVKATSQVMLGLAIGLVCQLVAYFLVKVLNSQRRNGAVLLTVGLGSSAMAAFDVLMYQELGALALGLGATAGAIVQTAIALSLLRLWPQLARSVAPVLPALALSLVVGLIGPTNGGWGIAMIFVHCAVWALAVIAIPELRAVARSVVPKR